MTPRAELVAVLATMTVPLGPGANNQPHRPTSPHFANAVQPAGMRSLTAALAARGKPVFVISDTQKRLVGLHARRADQTYTSYVFGFRDHAAAILVARSMEAHRRRHGAYPDFAASGMMRVRAADLCPDAPLTTLAVQRVTLADLLAHQQAGQHARAPRRHAQRDARGPRRRLGRVRWAAAHAGHAGHA